MEHNKGQMGTNKNLRTEQSSQPWDTVYPPGCTHSIARTESQSQRGKSHSPAPTLSCILCRQLGKKPQEWHFLSLAVWARESGICCRTRAWAESSLPLLSELIKQKGLLSLMRSRAQQSPCGHCHLEESTDFRGGQAVLTCLSPRWRAPPGSRAQAWQGEWVLASY